MYQTLRFLLMSIARLPWWALYALSSLLFFFIYHVVWYRRKLVWRNLAAAFPEMDAEQINDISISFYKNLCDQMVETIKLLHAGPEDILERFEVDTKVYQQLFGEGRHVLQATGHQFNWEWGNWVLNHRTSFAIRIIYMMVGSGVMERIVKEYRTRHGSILIAANDLKTLMEDPKGPGLTVFLADQNPSDRRRAQWEPFLGRPAPFHRGLEILARRKGHAVVFDEMVKVKRGHYRSISHLAFEDGSKTEEGEITRAYVRFLEESIRRQPENWLWSHDRWKHRPPVEEHT
jgi:Kdo2-lipid IVA lauroyltransferase/acyltransferase